MLAALRTWLKPAAGRPYRALLCVRPQIEALETRAVLSISITANIGGLTPPVTSVTLPRPMGAGLQDVSLILRASAEDQQLFRDAAAGRILQHVKITLSDGERGTDTIDMTDAVISSYRLVPGPTSDNPSIALTLLGRAEQSGSISATIDGATLSVVSMTIPESTSREASDVSLVVKVSAGVTTLLQNAGEGKVITEVKIRLDGIGNGSTETITLKNVLISSFQYVGGGSSLEVEIHLVAEQETIQIS